MFNESWKQLAVTKRSILFLLVLGKVAMSSYVLATTFNKILNMLKHLYLVCTKKLGFENWKHLDLLSKGVVIHLLFG